ncbi:MAG: LamG-like jellyroll fold domain-containing protein [Flammeovirgaceae bacterium]
MQQFKKMKAWLLCLLGFLLLPQLDAAIPKVLNLPANGYDVNVNTGIYLQNLITTGNSGEATIEFWVRQSNNGQWSLRGDRDKAFYLQGKSNNQLSVTFANSQNVSLEAATWYHIALVFFNNGTSVRIYKDAVNVGIQSVSGTIGDLWFLKENGQVEFAEIRAWNRRRTTTDIYDNYFRSFINDDYNVLKSAGLTHLYTGNATTDAATHFISELTQLRWNNEVDSNVKQQLRVNSQYGNTKLAEVVALNHPIYGNRTLFLTVTKGYGAGANQNLVELEWLHIDGATSYKIKRGNTLIETKSVSAVNAGEKIATTDNQLLPGLLQEYNVEAYVGNTLIDGGTDKAFIFPNGEISGEVKAEQQAVEGSELTARPVSGSSGNALTFNAGARAIAIQNVEVFRNNTDFSIEFWYKGSGNNTVFKIGNTEVRFSSNKLQFRKNGATLATETSAGSTNTWHHYAVTVDASSCKLYRDGALTKTASSNASNLAIDFVDQFEINGHAAGTYSLDELRIWDDVRTEDEINQRHTHMISPNDVDDRVDLLLYYRFDMGITVDNREEVYNQAIHAQTIGNYHGAVDLADNKINWAGSTGQPAALAYGTLTKINGTYLLSGINPGSSTAGLEYKITPNNLYLSDDDFSPPFRDGLNIKASFSQTNYKHTGVNFNDNSTQPFSGTAYFLDGITQYPVPVSQSLAIDDAQLDPSSNGASTDIQGGFSINVPFGRRTVKMYQDNSNGVSYPKYLSFEKPTAHATLQKNLTITTHGTTWSGWIRKTATPSSQQTILQLGNQYRLVMKTNNKMALVNHSNGQQKVESPVTISNTNWVFFAVTLEGNTVKLYIDQYTPNTGTSNGDDISGTFYLGAKNGNSEYFDGNLKLIECRKTIYTADQIKALHQGQFIEGDDAQLLFSFGFQEEKSEHLMRSISRAAQAHNYVLELSDSVTYDDVLVQPDFSRVSRYSYRAEAPSAFSGLIDPNDPTQFNYVVTDIVSGVSFINETRYGFVGNLVMPNGYNIGSGWTVEALRTDILSPEFKRTNATFNQDHTVFVIEDLIPGIYQITLNHPAIGAPLFVSEVDMTRSWAQHEFVYRAPLSIDAHLVARLTDVSDPSNNQVQITFTDLGTDDKCADGTYILESGAVYSAAINAYEAYGNDTYYVPGIQYNFGGKFGDVEDTDLLDAGNAGLLALPAQDGQDTFLVQAFEPNLFADHKRILQVVGVKTDEFGATETADDKIEAYVTGSVQNQSSFTIKAPASLLAVVHDPPGDNSSVTFNREITTTSKQEFNFEFNRTYELEFGQQTKKTTDLGTWAGVGGGVLTLTTANKTETKNLFNITTTAKLNTTDVFSSATTFGQTFSTSSSGIPGKWSDLFIFSETAIDYGIGTTLTVDAATCAVNMEESTIYKVGKETFAALDYYTVKTAVIPGFQQLIDAEEAGANDQQKIKAWQDNVDRWELILADNDSLYNPDSELEDYEFLANAALETRGSTQSSTTTTQDFAFGGEGVAVTLSEKYSESSDAVVGGGLKIEHANKNKIDLSFFGPGFVLDIKRKTSYEISNKETDGSTEAYGHSITFKDNDPDNFRLDMKVDNSTDYATPVFLTRSGVSTCPWEPNTSSLIGVAIDLQPEENGDYSKIVPVGAAPTVTFKVRAQDIVIPNSDSGIAYAKDYRFWIGGATDASNPATLNDLSFKIDGDGLSNALGRVYQIPDHGEFKNFNFTVTKNNNSDTKIYQIPLVVASACMTGSAALTNDFNIMDSDPSYYGGPEYLGLRDTVLLTVEFAQPCIENINVLAPEANWIVNSTSSSLPIRFQPVGVQSSFTKIRVERRQQGSSSVISSEVLKEDMTITDGVYSFDYNMANVPDANWEIRLVPVCGTSSEDWATSNPSAWILGSVNTGIVGVNFTTPLNNGISTDGNISVTYYGDLNVNDVTTLNVKLRGPLVGKPYTPYSLNLPNHNSKAEIAAQPALNVSGSYAIEFWVNPTSISNSDEQGIIGANQAWISVQNGYVKHAGQTASIRLQQNAWNHVVCVYDGDAEVSIYVGGELATSGTVDSTSGTLFDNQSNVDWFIGQSALGDAYRGNLDDIRIWNVARSLAQIRDNHLRQLTGNEQNLVAYFPLENDNIAGEALYDFTGSITNTSFVNTVNWAANEAPAFDFDEIIHDIPLDAAQLNPVSNKIVLKPNSNFPASYLEGATLTASVTNVRAANGNPAENKSWTFTMNQNPVGWVKANHAQEADIQAASVAFDLQFHNGGAGVASYDPFNWPSWLSASRLFGTVPVTQDNPVNLPGGNTHTLTMLAQLGGLGTYTKETIYMRTYNSSGFASGYEALTLEIVKVGNVARITVSSPSGIDESELDEQISNELSLAPNHPNPFSEQTTFTYQLPEAMPIAFNIYDQLGRKVHTLFAGAQQAGKHELTWDRKGSNGSILPAGLYIYELVTPAKRLRKKLLVE